MAECSHDPLTPPAPQSGIRVLIADDHTLFRQGLRALLATTADIHCVGEAASGDDALGQLIATRPHVVLMDINMPGMSGIETTRRMMRAQPTAAVIMVTMLEDDASLFAAMRAGARGYVLKGANPNELLGSIRAVAQGQVLFGPAVAGRVLRFFSGSADRHHPGFQPLAELTEREREILSLMARHTPNPEIAQQLGVSGKTVSNHISNIFNKLQVVDRAAAIQRAREAGLE